MFPKISLIYLCLLLAQNIIASDSCISYEAKVMDYSPTKMSSPNETLLINLKYFLDEIGNSKGIDIVVFPEYGLTSVDFVLLGDLSLIKQFLIDVPDESDEVLCGKPGIHNVIDQLSCKIAEANLYAVVNLLELVNESGKITKIYNTNVVFDRKGAIVAKYRKINLFGSELIILSPGNEIKTFKTDFGVEFGLFTCFDILFKNPSADVFTKYPTVTDIIFTTAWFSEVPWYAALGVQDGYAKKYGVNLLASGHVDPSIGSGGSGFYLPGNQRKTFLPLEQSKTPISQAVEIIHERQPEKNCITMSNSTQNTVPDGIEKFKTKTLEFTNMVDSYTFLDILENENNHFQDEMCNGILCCKFDITYDSLSQIDSVYMAIGSEFACGIIACDKEKDPSTCARRNADLPNANFNKIEIEVRFDNRPAYHHFPVSSNLALQPLDFTYCESPESIVLTTFNQKGLVHFGFIMGWENK